MTTKVRPPRYVLGADRLWHLYGHPTYGSTVIPPTWRVARLGGSGSGAVAPPTGTGGQPTGPRYTSYQSLYSTGDTFTSVVQNKLPAGQILTLPEGIFQFSDFSVNGRYGLQLPLGSGIVGSGRNTILEMVEHTSTKASGTYDPPQSNSDGVATQQTNQLYLIRVEGNNCIVSNFHLRGTNQSPGTDTLYPYGHNYNGIFFINTTNLLCEDLLVSGVPGSQGGPPGETFPTNFFSSTNGQFNRLEIDGVRRTGDQAGYSVTASIGNNSSSNFDYTDTYIHDCATGSFAHWQCHDLTHHNTRSINNGVGNGNPSNYNTAHSAHGINFERCYNATVYNPTISIPNGGTLKYPNLFGGNVGDANTSNSFHTSWNSDVSAYGSQPGSFLKVINPTFNWDSRSGTSANPNYVVMSYATYRGVSNIYQKVQPYHVSVYQADGVTPFTRFAYAN